VAISVRTSRSRWSSISGLPTFGAVGVYALYLEDSLVYVGSSGNIRDRLQCHGRHFRFDRIKTRKVRDVKMARRIERKLLYRLRPAKNAALPASLYAWNDNGR